MTVKVWIDNQQHTSKPDNISAIQTRKKAERATEYTIEQIAAAIGRWQTITPAVFHTAPKPGKPNAVSFVCDEKQLFLVDIDNDIEEAPQLSSEASFQICKNNAIMPALWYHSFRNGKDGKEKYRLCFLCNEPITDTNKAQHIQRVLMELFPQGDKACSDLCRTFYGTNQDVTIVEGQPTFSYEDICRIAATREQKKEQLKIQPALPATTKERLNDNLSDMLAVIPADNYDTWVKVGAALKYEDFPFEVFDEWSKNSSKYGKTRETWDSFGRTGGNVVTGATLVFLAKQNGWKPPQTAYPLPQLQQPRRATPTLPPAQTFVEKLSRDDLLNPDKIRPVFELPAESGAAYIAEIETRAKREKLWNPWQQLSKSLKKQQAEQERAERAANLPQWAYLDGFGQVRINEPIFIRLFTEKNALVCENGNVYGMDGLIEDRFIRQTIQREISEHITADLAAKTDKLLKALKNDRNGTLPPPQLDKLHLQNGTLTLRGRVLSPEKEFARNRLPVSYDHAATCPVWLKVVENLLEPEDRLTLQEYFGYLLIPTNRAQKALFICGKGGEGKSLIVKVVSDLLGNSCFSGKLQNVQERFGLAGLEGKLCFADDDIDSAAFRSTATLKKIVTANKPMRIEKKGIDPYPGTIFARFLCCGNSFATALYDSSDGFFRRQLLLLTRPGSQVQNPDRELSDKLTAELPGILNWALDGLERLQQNGWTFTISDRSRQALEEQRRNACNVISFLESNYVERGKNLQVFAKDLYCAYCHWCGLNQEEPVKSRTFVSFIREHYSPDIQYSENIAIQKIRARGFKGITYVDNWSISPIV